MKRETHYFLIGLLATLPIFMSSCSTTELYYQPLTERPAKPWKGTSGRWGGYLETSPKPGVYTIRYEAYNRPTPEAAAYFTRLRAAERSLIDQKFYFYETSPLNLNSRSEESYFPAYVIPGEWETRRIRVCDTCPCTGKDINCKYIYEREWCPPEYVPDKWVTNYIHTAKMTISYQGKESQKRNAVAIIHEALNDSARLGTPKLDPRALHTLSSLTPQAP